MKIAIISLCYYYTPTQGAIHISKTMHGYPVYFVYNKVNLCLSFCSKEHTQRIIKYINITNMTKEKMIEEMLQTGHLTEAEAKEWQELGDKHVKVLYHAFYKLAVNK